jgi:hypothetical protein
LWSGRGPASLPTCRRRFTVLALACSWQCAVLAFFGMQLAVYLEL